MVGPHCLRLIDTAGLNASPTHLEKLGMEKTMERLAEADLVLIVVDGSADATPPTDLAIDGVNPLTNMMLIVNKGDLPSGVHTASVPEGVPVLRVSAKTGEGLEELQRAIIAAADRFRVDVGEDEVAINARHATALKDVASGLAAALHKLRTEAPQELLASDLRSALGAFEQILGRVDNERMLDQLFATFCIGK